jgi:hypothetical protein
VFEAIEEEDRVVENDNSGNPALRGSCNDRAKQLHASPSGLHFLCVITQSIISLFFMLQHLFMSVLYLQIFM